ncbi:hypothetical protein JTB14_030458 [Gonioctena quinquepunctata]|nr:hypothetical protein JTB14_030458 [Gonioctena quinquepunctata]
MVNNPGKTINLENIPTLAGRAYQRAFRPSNITKGFEHTGICPYNPNIFSDADSASVTDRPNPGIENQQIRLEAVNNVPNEPSNEDEDIAGPSTSDTNIEEATHFTPPKKAVTSLKTPEEVRPFQALTSKITRRLAEGSFSNGIVAKDDLILVKFFTKKSHKYYVGQVRDIEQNGDYLVNVVRNPVTISFSQPLKMFQWYPADDAVKLPHPCSVGGTARVNRKLSFPINFTKFDNVN